MRIYQVTRSVNHELCQSTDAVDFLRALEAIPTTGEASSADLLPPITITRVDQRGRRLRPSDCPWYLPNVLFLTPLAVARVGPYLRERGQIIPVMCEGSKMFVFRITKVIDALSDQAEVDRNNDGSLGIVYKWAFKPDVVDGEEMFTIPEFTTGGTLFVQEEFPKLWKQSGLVGVDFELRWKHEPA
jgi:hypothetical protein